ncbi:hypothetical protein [Limnohabitans sp.]
MRGVYHRSTYTKDRAHLLQWWADYLDTKAKGADVIDLEAHRAA